MKRRSLDLGIILCTAGGTLLVIREPLSRSFPTAERSWAAALWLGILLCVLGLVALVLPSIIGLGTPLKESFVQVLFPGLELAHFRTFAEEADLPVLHTLYREHFDDVPSLEHMRSWRHRCDTSFVLVYRESSGADLAEREQMVGSFKFLPLTAAGIKSLELGQITGSTFKPEHVCASRSRASAYYIGDVFASDSTAKAVVLHELKAACLEQSRRGVAFYARPLTSDGRRVMKRRGFVQVADGTPPEIGKLCRLDPGTLAGSSRSAKAASI